MHDEAPASELAKYGLVPADRRMSYTGAKYQALPATAIQTVWLKADGILKQATDMYYGRVDQKLPTTNARTK